MTNKRYIFILLISITAFVLALSACGFMLHKVSIMKSDADIKTKDIITKQKTADYYKNIKDLNLGSTEDRARLEKILVDYNDAVSFIEQIEKTASDMGVKLDIGNLADNKKADGKTLPLIGKIDFTVSISGTWDKVHRFILALEDLPYKVTVNDVQFNKAGSELKDKSKDSLWRAGVNFSVLTRSK